jgi:tRNA dimethylallyltransferase
MNSDKIRVAAVAGPTASGKSALAMLLCRKYGGELISCDSMQIYRRMDIGTAKPSRAERAEIPHHLIDICDPSEDFSVAEFAVLADRAIRETAERGRFPVLCGGTGLYLDSVLSGVDFGELEADPAYRAELAQAAEEKGALFLHQMLREKDPDAAEKIHPNNVKRVIRALEICRLSGMTKTEWDKAAVRRVSPYDAAVIALDYRNRDILYERINRRVDEMLDAGLENEVRSLLADGCLTPDSTAGGAIGYKELIEYINGLVSYAEAVEAVKTATRRYAKRQLTWLRRNEAVRWLYPDDYPDTQALFTAAEALIFNT